MLRNSDLNDTPKTVRDLARQMIQSYLKEKNVVSRLTMHPSRKKIIELIEAMIDNAVLTGEEIFEVVKCKAEHLKHSDQFGFSGSEGSMFLKHINRFIAEARRALAYEKHKAFIDYGSNLSSRYEEYKKFKDQCANPELNEELKQRTRALEDELFVLPGDQSGSRLESAVNLVYQSTRLEACDLECECSLEDLKFQLQYHAIGDDKNAYPIWNKFSEFLTTQIRQQLQVDPRLEDGFRRNAVIELKMLLGVGKNNTTRLGSDRSKVSSEPLTKEENENQELFNKERGWWQKDRLFALYIWCLKQALNSTDASNDQHPIDYKRLAKNIYQYSLMFVENILSQFKLGSDADCESFSKEVHEKQYEELAEMLRNLYVQLGYIDDFKSRRSMSITRTSSFNGSMFKQSEGVDFSRSPSDPVMIPKQLGSSPG